METVVVLPLVPVTPTIESDRPGCPNAAGRRQGGGPPAVAHDEARQLRAGRILDERQGRPAVGGRRQEVVPIARAPTHGNEERAGDHVARIVDQGDGS